MRPKPKKSLGQNFLQDPNIRSKIMDSCAFSCDDTVIEIGPGQGAMTGLIAAKVKRLYCVELDKELAGTLREQFKDNSAVTIIQGDILQRSDIIASASTAAGGKVRIFGNIPYYISSPILESLFEAREYISTIHIMVQKEFGRRVAAPAGSDDYGSFSCFIGYYTVPTIEFTVKRTCFYPVPKVDSCFLKLEVRSQPPVKVSDERLLFRIIRASFQQRRKQMRNSISSIAPEDKLEKVFSVCSIDPKARAERLDLAQFACISNQLSS